MRALTLCRPTVPRAPGLCYAGCLVAVPCGTRSRASRTCRGRRRPRTRCALAARLVCISGARTGARATCDVRGVRAHPSRILAPCVARNNSTGVNGQSVIYRAACTCVGAVERYPAYAAACFGRRTTCAPAPYPTCHGPARVGRDTQCNETANAQYRHDEHEICCAPAEKKFHSTIFIARKRLAIWERHS